MTYHGWTRANLPGGIVWLCHRCGFRVVFPNHVLHSGLTYSSNGVVVADAAGGAGKGRVRSLVLTSRTDNCDEQLVRSVMTS